MMAMWSSRHSSTRTGWSYITGCCRDRRSCILESRSNSWAGDRIWAAISYKYTSDELKELLEKRFDTEIYMNEPENYALALCSRK